MITKWYQERQGKSRQVRYQCRAMSLIPRRKTGGLTQVYATTILKNAVFVMTAFLPAPVLSTSGITSTSTDLIHGRAPIVKDIFVSGEGDVSPITTSSTGEKIFLNYKFEDGDGDTEAGSSFVWFWRPFSSKSDDDYSVINGQTTSSLIGTGNQVVRGCITPNTDSRLTYPSSGEQKCSGPIDIINSPTVENLVWDSGNTYIAGNSISASYKINLNGMDGGNQSKYGVFYNLFDKQAEALVDANPELADKNLMSPEGEIVYNLSDSDVGSTLTIVVKPNNGVFGRAVAISAPQATLGLDYPPTILNQSTVARNGTHTLCNPGSTFYVDCIIDASYSINNAHTLNKDDQTKYSYVADGKVLFEGTVAHSGTIPPFTLPDDINIYYKQLSLVLTPSSDGIKYGAPSVSYMGVITNPKLFRAISSADVVQYKTTDASGKLVPGSKVRAVYPMNTPYGVSYEGGNQFKWSTKASMTYSEFVNTGYMFATPKQDDTGDFTIPNDWSGRPLYLHIAASSPAGMNTNLTSVYFGDVAGVQLADNSVAPRIANVKLATPELFAYGGQPAFTYDLNASGNYLEDQSIVEIFHSSDGINWTQSSYQPTVSVGVRGQFSISMGALYNGKYIKLKITPRAADSSGVIVATGTTVEWDSKSANAGPAGLGIPYKSIQPSVTNLKLKLEDEASGYTVGNKVKATYDFVRQQGMDDVSKFYWSSDATSAGGIELNGDVVKIAGETPYREITKDDIGQVPTIHILMKEVDSSGVYRSVLGVYSLAAPTFIVNKPKTLYELTHNGLGYSYFPDGDGPTTPDAGPLHSWGHADNGCQNKGSGWRLPTAAELVAISGSSVTRPSSWPAGHTYWTSEKDGDGQHKTVYMATGSAGQIPDGQWTAAVCVSTASAR